MIGYCGGYDATNSQAMLSNATLPGYFQLRKQYVVISTNGVTTNPKGSARILRQ